MKLSKWIAARAVCIPFSLFTACAVRPTMEMKWEVPPGTTNEKIDKDNYECRRDAAGIPNPYVRDGLQVACLKARGYKLKEVPSAP